MSDEIAVIGVGCRYPEADDPGELWENVLSQRRSFRRIPAERLRLEDYHSPDAATPDATYSTQAAVLEDYRFDRVRFRIGGSTYRATDLTHWLALDVAADTLDDAGFDRLGALDRRRVGAVVGNTLTGEFSRAGVSRLRWPYVRRVVAAALAREGWDEQRRAGFLRELERDFKAPFAPVGEDSLVGGLSNAIAGRICNMFDFGGGGFTVDGACAASLLAVQTACTALARGELDLALAGGVDLSLDPFELVGFAKAGALARDLMRVYDERSSGFWPGEGCGFVALVRLEDARAWDARVYAVIRGWGTSSDGRGGITRPEFDGQVLALRRAYERAGYGPDSVDLFEGHGTGTPVGDATELAALAHVTRGAAGDHRAAVGSIKANIGHTKAAAGVAGLLKAVLSLHHGVLPPATGCERPHQVLREQGATLRVLPEPETWPAGGPARAGVSAMGFGGINTHVTLEAPGRARPGRPASGLSGRERVLATTRHDRELVPLAALTHGALAEQAAALAERARDLSFGQLRDLGIERAREAPASAPVRGAVLCATPWEFEAGLRELEKAAASGGAGQLDPAKGWLLGAPARPPRIAFLFSGQAAPVPVDGGALARRFPAVARTVSSAGFGQDADRSDTAVAQPVIAAVSAATAALLGRLGIEAEIALGHSLGELTALHWAGVFTAEELVDLARTRGRAMSACPGEGAMAGIGAGEAEVKGLVGDLPVRVAAYNAPDQLVVSGPTPAVLRAVERASRAGVRAARLPVSHAFHSPLVAPAAEPLARWMRAVPRRALRRRVASTVTGQLLEPDSDVARLLERQLTEPVLFSTALELVAASCDLLVEVGPGAILATLARGSGVPAVATDAGAESLHGLLATAAAAYCAGAPVRLAALAGGRAAPRRPALEPRAFLANPCEQAPVADAESPTAAAPAGPDSAASEVAAPDAGPAAPGEGGSPIDVLRQLVADRAELPMEAVSPHSHLLSDLNMSSITVVQVATEAASRLGVSPPLGPGELAGVTVGELAAALADAPTAGDPRAGEAVEGVGPWVRPFALEWVPLARPATGRPCRWTVLGPECELTSAVREAFAGGDGEPALALCVPPERSAEAATRLLELVQEAGSGCWRRVAVLQHDGGAGGIARTLFLERPGLEVRLIGLPPEPAGVLAEARTEAESGAGFEEVRLAGSERFVRRLRPYEPAAAAAPRLGAGDVLLVTGGGRGIGAASALALARVSGARVALLGRSPAAHPDVRQTLERLAAEGFTARYYRADASDPREVAAAAAAAARDLGTVTAVLHAAGTNKPAPLAELDAEALRATLRPKVEGLRHVLAALDPSALRLLVGFGSVIAEAGLPGEAHYALANDWLRLEIDDVAARLPGCRCLTVQWSVWSGIGMGERLGSVDSLAHQGVMPIDPADGCALLSRLVDAGEPLPAHLVAAGRIGDPPTLPPASPQLPLGRFLEQPLVHVPGIELVTEAVLDPATDHYLTEHALDGTPLLPAVTAQEAMAQVASALAGGAVPARIEHLTLPRPVTVPPDGRRTVRVAALAREPGVVEVVLRSEESGFDADHCRATYRFGRVEPPAAPPAPPAGSLVDVTGDLYGRMLFHGPRFRRVEGYAELSARRCTAVVAAEPATAWFGSFLPQGLLLGDMGARDAFVHAAQACIPHRRVLPVEVESVTLVRPPAGRLILHAVERWSDATTLRYDLAVYDAEGWVVEVWRGLTLRVLEQLPAPDAWHPGVVAPYVERELADLLPGALTAAAVLGNGAGSVGRRGPEAARRVLEARARRGWDGEQPPGDLGEVAVAHRRPLTLAVAGKAPIGCAIEVAAGVSDEPAAPGAGGDVVEALRTVHGETPDVAAARVRSAERAARTAGGSAPAELALERVVGGGWVVLRAGQSRIATARLRVAGMPGPCVLSVLTPAQETDHAPD